MLCIYETNKAAHKCVFVYYLCMKMNSLELHARASVVVSAGSNGGLECLPQQWGSPISNQDHWYSSCSQNPLQPFCLRAQCRSSGPRLFVDKSRRDFGSKTLYLLCVMCDTYCDKVIAALNTHYRVTLKCVAINIQHHIQHNIPFFLKDVMYVKIYHYHQRSFIFMHSYCTQLQ